VQVLRPEFTRQPSPGVGEKRGSGLRFGWFWAWSSSLGAAVIRTAISPTWTDIGQLSAIATIRTVLNYFLEKDIEKYGESHERPEEPQLRTAA
jgi:hypothetical protein